MPGKCKFQDSWLLKGIYQDWLAKDAQDIHLARCEACCKSIKLQSMGEAALTSHAGGTGHKIAVRKLAEDNLMLRNAAVQMNGSGYLTEDSKEQVAICLQRDAHNRTTGNESDRHHSPTTHSYSHNAANQEVTSSAVLIPPGTSDEPGRCPPQHQPAADRSKLKYQLTADTRQEALELEQQMKMVEWENKMKLLTMQQELVKEEKKAVCEKRKASEAKKAYYQAKLKKMGEGGPSSSTSCSDEEEKMPDVQ